MTDINGITNLSYAGPGRVDHGQPKAYRLARRNGELVLQACFQSRQGPDYGHEWLDIPIVNLDADEIQ